MIRENDILKAVLMLRRVGNIYKTKEEQIAEQKDWIAKGIYTDDSFHEWIDWMREELAKTPEQREQESDAVCEEMAEDEAELEYDNRNYRDEWDDLWADRARECGAQMW